MYTLYTQEDLDQAKEAFGLPPTAPLIKVLVAICNQYKDRDEVLIGIDKSLVSMGYLTNLYMLANSTKSRVPFLSVKVTDCGDHIGYHASKNAQPTTFMDRLKNDLYSDEPTLEYPKEDVPRSYTYYPSVLRSKIKQYTDMDVVVRILKTKIRINKILK